MKSHKQKLNSAALEVQQIVAHGVSRGKKIQTSQVPDGAKGWICFNNDFVMSLLRSFYPFVFRPTVDAVGYYLTPFRG
jgi:hypothetical protein